jgi:hypothetical protein
VFGICVKYEIRGECKKKNGRLHKCRVARKSRKICAIKWEKMKKEAFSLLFHCQ